MCDKFSIFAQIFNRMSKENRKKRSDIGGRHRKWVYGDSMSIGMYNYAGKLEGIFNGMDAILEWGRGTGVTYRGVRDCLLGRQAHHAGKVWRIIDKVGEA